MIQYQRRQDSIENRARRRSGKLPLRRIKGYLIFGLLLTFVLILIISTVGKREWGAPQEIGLEFLGLLQKPVAGITAYGKDVWEDYIALWQVGAENRQLKEQLQQYKALNTEYREAVATNIRLQRLLDFKESLPPPTITARVIGKDPGLWFRSVVIDRGSSSGLREGMPVVTVEGVVGQVVNTSPHNSKVLLANGPNSAIEAMVQSTRVRGIIKGDGLHGLQMYYVLKSSEVREGDLVVASELGGVFPKGVAIGTITKVSSTERGMFHQIEVTPAVDFFQLENVIVYMKENSLAE